MSTSTQFKEKSKLHIIALSFLIAAGLNTGLIQFAKVNIFNIISVSLNLPIISTIIHSLILLSALYIMTKRDSYLPFLGDTIYPCNLLSNTMPHSATITRQVTAPPNSKVIYWAAESKSDPNDKIITDPSLAYEDYNNSGVTTTDNNGIATLKVRPPTQYSIPSGKILSKHIHYRYCISPNILSSIQTINI